MRGILRWVSVLVALLLPLTGGAQDANTLKAKLQSIQQAKGWSSDDAAEAHLALGDAYRKLNNLALAEEHYLVASLIYGERAGQDNPASQRLKPLLESQGHNKDALKFVKFLVNACEKHLGDSSPLTANSQKILADQYMQQSRIDEAQKMYEKALGTAGRAYGEDAPGIVAIIDPLTDIYRAQAQPKSALPLYHRALAIAEKLFGPTHEEPEHYRELIRQAEAASQGVPVKGHEKHEHAQGADLAALERQASALVTQGDYRQATIVAERLLKAAAKELGPVDPNFAVVQMNVARLYDRLGEYEKAELLYIRAIEIFETRSGQDAPDSLAVEIELAGVYSHQMRYDKAESLWKKVLANYEKMQGPMDPNVSVVMGNLANLYNGQGKDVLAETHFKRALVLSETLLGLEHPNLSVQLNNLAMFYMEQGKYAQAESLLKRAIAIKEKSFGRDHPNLMANLNNIGMLYYKQKKYAEAESFYKRALMMTETALGIDHPLLPTSLNNLAEVYRDQGRFDLANPLFKRALAIAEKAGGGEHPDVALTLNNLARLNQMQGRYQEAETLYHRAVSVFEKKFGGDHPIVAKVLRFQAGLFLEENKRDRALGVLRRTTAIYRQRIVDGEAMDSAFIEAAKAQESLFAHIKLLYENPKHERRESISGEGFQVAQLAAASGTSIAVAKMAARFANGSDALAGLIKRKQDATIRRTNAEAKLLKAASQAPEKRDRDSERKVQDELAEQVREINALEHEIAGRFPDYQELTRPEPLTIAQVQALLRPNEAIMAYAVDAAQSWLWVVRREAAEFIELKCGGKDIDEQVRKIRTQMEPDDSGQLPSVDIAGLHALYQCIFSPAIPSLSDVQHIMVVPTGSLQSLPFAMLVKSPSRLIQDNSGYRDVDWLTKSYSFSVLPSVSSIRAFRQFAKSSMGAKPFIGFGDPVLSDAGGAARSARRNVDIASLFRGSAANPGGHQQADIVDVTRIRTLPRLPETADEIMAMAKILDAESKDIWLQAKASETNVKGLELSQYRILAFATHGIMAGEISRITEPGLILTPPLQGTYLDDGYLSAGEIAQLQLNADLVLLSACNTAAADGSIGAEGLSGLAKAFFYAGARSLLVSHWPVNSEATVPLTTAMLREHQANPAQGKAAAHRKAMLALMTTPNHTEYGHPLFWAPFVVVGEGGNSAPQLVNK